MGKPADRNARIMREEFGTAQLITDYGAIDKALAAKNDPARIRNAEDYDDWEYGTEPIPHDHTWTRKRST
jgi:hypothetical protein